MVEIRCLKHGPEMSSSLFFFFSSLSQFSFSLLHLSPLLCIEGAIRGTIFGCDLRSGSPWGGCVIVDLLPSLSDLSPLFSRSGVCYAMLAFPPPLSSFSPARYAHVLPFSFPSDPASHYSRNILEEECSGHG
jgi:hypothetical protein